MPVPPLRPDLIEQLDQAHMFACDIASTGIEPEKLDVIGQAIRAARAALSAAPQETDIENRAAAWRKKALLAEGYWTTPPASEVERCVRLILGSTSGSHIVPAFVDLIYTLSAPDTKE